MTIYFYQRLPSLAPSSGRTSAPGSGSLASIHNGLKFWLTTEDLWFKGTVLAKATDMLLVGDSDLEKVIGKKEGWTVTEHPRFKKKQQPAP